MKIDFWVGKNHVHLEREGGVITFHRDYDGKVESRLTHVFDDRPGNEDWFRVHQTDSHTVTRQVFWSCMGRMGDVYEMGAVRAAIAPLYSTENK